MLQIDAETEGMVRAHCAETEAAPNEYVETVLRSALAQAREHREFVGNDLRSRVLRVVAPVCRSMAAPLGGAVKTWLVGALLACIWFPMAGTPAWQWGRALALISGLVTGFGFVELATARAVAEERAR